MPNRKSSLQINLTSVLNRISVPVACLFLLSASFLKLPSTPVNGYAISGQDQVLKIREFELWRFHADY